MLRALQFFSLLMVGSLFALTGLRQFFIYPLEDSSTNLVWFIVQVLPLLLVLPGLLRQKSRGFFFTAMVSTLYFVHGVLLAVDPDDRMLGLFEVCFAITLLSMSTYAVKRASV